MVAGGLDFLLIIIMDASGSISFYVLALVLFRQDLWAAFAEFSFVSVGI